MRNQQAIIKSFVGFPIHESCTHFIWDYNSKEIDKSDSKRCTIIHALNTDGWEEFAKQYGLEPDNIPSL